MPRKKTSPSRKNCRRGRPALLLLASSFLLLLTFVIYRGREEGEAILTSKAYCFEVGEFGRELAQMRDQGESVYTLEEALRNKVSDPELQAILLLALYDVFYQREVYPPSAARTHLESACLGHLLGEE